MRVLIVGGGAVGRELAEQLANTKRAELVLVDSSEACADRLAADFDALILHGDGTHPEVLEEARVRDCDAVVAATGDDATNLVIAMLVMRYQVPRVVVRLEDLALRPAAEELGVSEIVSAQRSAAGAMMRALRGEHHADFTVVSRGGIDLVELPAEKLHGTKVRDCDMGRHTLLVALRRGHEEVLLAKADLEIERDDTLIFMVDDEDALEKLIGELRTEGREEASG